MRSRKQIMNWLPIVLLYLFLFLGGLWHLLGKFQEVMRFSAGPILILLSAIVWFTTRTSLQGSQTKRRFDLFSLFVIVGGILVETVGVQTGFPFGSYHYGETLLPAVGKVPIAIGFAWLGVLLSSTAISQRLLNRFHVDSPWVVILLSAFLMVVFDVVMEPAAIRLGYWDWGGSIPLQNYIAWWALGALFGWIGYASGALQEKASFFSIHVYFAQLLYFGMSLL